MSQKDVLLDQVLEEILREKTSYYLGRDKAPDFWVLVSPSFIKEQNLNDKIRTTKFFQDQKDKIVVTWKTGGFQEFYVTLISSDEDYMSWIKLRLGYFEEMEASRNHFSSSSYRSDGVCGTLLINKFKEQGLFSILDSNYSHLHPDILNFGLSTRYEGFFLGNTLPLIKK